MRSGLNRKRAEEVPDGAPHCRGLARPVQRWPHPTGEWRGQPFLKVMGCPVIQPTRHERSSPEGEHQIQTGQSTVGEGHGAGGAQQGQLRGGDQQPQSQHQPAGLSQGQGSPHGRDAAAWSGSHQGHSAGKPCGHGLARGDQAGSSGTAQPAGFEWRLRGPAGDV